MSGTITVPTLFAAATSGTTVQLDAAIAALTAAFNNPLTYAQYSTDSGAVNAYVATLAPAPATQAALLGVVIAFKATTANTAASTLNVNALGAQAIVRPGGGALVSADLTGTVLVVWDGTNYILQSRNAANGQPPASQLTNALGADVLLNNTGNYFDGPSIAQGTAFTWFVTASIVVTDTVGAAAIFVKLWDGTTVIASGNATTPAITSPETISLSGFITAPAGNLRISARDSTSTSGKILFNSTGSSKDATITAYRIA